LETEETQMPTAIANALHHAFSRVGKGLDQARREDLLTHIEVYRRRQAPLSVPVALLTPTPPHCPGWTGVEP
jgi:uncharacterized protein YbgA (DUF1722 family)